MKGRDGPAKGNYEQDLESRLRCPGMFVVCWRCKVCVLVCLGCSELSVSLVG